MTDAEKWEMKYHGVLHILKDASELLRRLLISDNVGKKEREEITRFLNTGSREA